MKRLIAALALLPLAACAQKAPPPEPIVERGGKPYQFTADPGALVAVDIAFQRAVREEGFAKAAKEYAAKDAQLLKGRRIPSVNAGDGDFMPPTFTSTDTWQVLMSCDGASALVESGGLTGDNRGFRIYTVWNKDGRGAWRWSMMTFAPYIEGAIPDKIVKTAVAKCGTRPPVTFSAPAVGEDMQTGLSRDQTLSWTSIVTPSKDSRLIVKLWDGSAMEQKLTVSIP